MVLQHVTLQTDREKPVDMERSVTAFVWPVNAPLSACLPAHTLKHREGLNLRMLQAPRELTVLQTRTHGPWTEAQ